MVVVIVAGGAQGAVNAEWKCKQRVWAFQLACDVLPQPRRNRRNPRPRCHVSWPTVCLHALVTQLPPRFCLQVRRVNRHHGHTGAVPSFVHGEQQARLPQEDPGQQAGGQTPVQLLPQHTQTTVSGPVWTSLLLLLLQQDSEVSGSGTARSVPLLRMGGVLGGGALTFCSIQSRNTTVWKCFRRE